jgi:hypothetical protein
MILTGFFIIPNAKMKRDPLVSCGDPVTWSPFQLNNRLLSFYRIKKCTSDVEIFIYFKI